jgi:hypothetical protein
MSIKSIVRRDIWEDSVLAPGGLEQAQEVLGTVQQDLEIQPALDHTISTRRVLIPMIRSMDVRAVMDQLVGVCTLPLMTPSLVDEDPAVVDLIPGHLREQDTIQLDLVSHHLVRIGDPMVTMDEVGEDLEGLVVGLAGTLFNESWPN